MGGRDFTDLGEGRQRIKFKSGDLLFCSTFYNFTIANPKVFSATQSTKAPCYINFDSSDLRFVDGDVFDADCEVRTTGG